MSHYGCWIGPSRRMEQLGFLKTRSWLAPGQMCAHCVWRTARTRSTQNRLQNWNFGNGPRPSHSLRRVDGRNYQSDDPDCGRQDRQRAMAHQNHVAKHTLSTLFAITRILAVA